MMPLKTLVKVSGINNLSDARYCAGMGVNLMGFPLDNSHPHYMTPGQFKAIIQWIEGVAVVGELNTTDPVVIQHILNHYGLDYLQLDYPIAPQHIACLDIPVLLRIQLQGVETLSLLQTIMHTYEPCIAYFLLESATGTVENLQSVINQLAYDFPVLQGCSVNAASLPSLLATKIQGIALPGGTEIKPGYKDYDQLAEVLELLTVA